ncbi:glycosyltransferase family 2 protein [Egicoccus halophilus]|uniref:Glycosyl transferase family 2 n=1 Tax=Egicoccus halophilus TaxID=1670830 RepID=A0A8J3EXB2_9ACTN|nr:glycosyltransferase [Egicoccus halophilus]GGI05412.1 hypothetical protein GCM10011354_13970 [Egicoccus halophilus]
MPERDGPLHDAPVSVVVIADGTPGLAGSLASVRPQAAAGEVLVVASPHLAPAARADLDGIDGIRVVQAPDARRSDLRNLGLELAAHDLVAFLDGGDLWLPGKVARQLTVMRDTGAAWSFGAGLVFSEGPRLEALLPAPSVEAAVAGLPYRNAVPATGSNLLVERAVLDRLGGFDPTVEGAADWELCIRLAEYGPPAVVVETVVAARWRRWHTERRAVDGLFAAAREIERRHAPRRADRPLDWPDLHRWVCHDALRDGHRSTAVRMGLGALRRRHPGGLELAARSLLPVRRRAPVQHLDRDVTTWLDRRFPRRVVSWPDGVEPLVRRLCRS